MGGEVRPGLVPSFNFVFGVCGLCLVDGRVKQPHLAYSMGYQSRLQIQVTFIHVDICREGGRERFFSKSLFALRSFLLSHFTTLKLYL